ncbi:MAG: glycosyltransferase [Candidatus Moraniibacteriota bacterium]|nr:MAG: glycosyltransferase [Candidatus Moranbacteria bacterium]
MLCNLHVVMNDCLHASRVLKETQSISKLLPRDGQVVVVAANRSGRAPSHERLDDHRSIERIGVNIPRFLRGKAATAVRFPLWMLLVLKRYLPLRPKMVNIHHAETLVLGALFKFLAGSKFVYDPHELEAEKNGYGALKKRLVAFLENFIIPYADEVFVVNRSISEEYARRYSCSPPHVLMNVPWFTEPPKRSRQLHDALGLSADKKICLYLGALTKGRGIEFIMDAFEAADSSEYVAVFVGYGPLQGAIEERARKCPCIYFHPAVQPTEVLDIAASADVGLCLIESVSLSYHYCLPNKFFEYLFAGIPVVVTPLPELTRLVDEYGVGVVLQEHTPQALQLAVREAGAVGAAGIEKNIEKVRLDYSWDAQEVVVRKVYGKYFGMSEAL